MVLITAEIDMLRMSRLADYGMIIATQMAREPERLISATALASEARLAGTTVSKILKLLSRGELVVAERGKQGGYRLSRRPAQISIAEVIDAIDGRFGLTECASQPGDCTRERFCAMREHSRRVDRAVRKTLEALTLAELARPAPPAVVTVLPHARSGGA